MSRKRKHKPYDKTNLIAAMRAVNRGKKLSATAKLYQVPKTTLYDHTRGKLKGSTRGPGRSLSMTQEEEQALVNYIKYMADRGRPITNDILKKFATSIIRRKEYPTQIDKDKGPSDKWCQRFRKRHPEIKLRRPDRASNARMEVSKEDVEEYFDLLETTINKLDLQNKPECIFNCDETGISGKEMIRGKVLVVDNQHPYQENINTSGGHLSINMAISAAGRCLPLMLIFSKSMPRNLDGLPNDWMLEKSPKGYMNGDLFVKWLKELFIPNCGRSRPVLLIMDNLASHLSPDTIDVAQQNQIELLCLPPNSTHMLQPLDVAVFHKFKSIYSKLVNQLGYTVTNIPREKIPHVIKHSCNSLCPQDYTTAFRRAGIWPTDQAVVLEQGKQTLRSRDEIENPKSIADVGLVPKDLEDIFVMPPEKSKSKRSSIRGARVITDTSSKDSTAEDCQEPTTSTSNPVADDPIPSTSDNQSKRKRKNSKTNKDKSNKATKKSSTLQQNTNFIEVHLDDGICEICMLNSRLEWVGCDNCDRWYHYVCLPHDVQTVVDFTIVTSTEWQCIHCSEQ